MSRTADYAIQGFIYQFTLTLQIILRADSKSKVAIEGPVEDIDVSTPAGIEAIQCKYHEAKDKFTLSSIYKPVLQMMNHYANDASKCSLYRLYAHFPSEKVGSKKKLTEEEIKQIRKSTAKDLKGLIKSLKHFNDVKGFLKKFEIEFGPTLKDLEKGVIIDLSAEGFSIEDSEDIFFPNAIHGIAELSIKHLESDRIVDKNSFIEELKKKKYTAITRWTKELMTIEKLFQKRREQLRTELNKNLRIRAFVLDSNYLNDFEVKVVQFIEDFVKKYNSKIKLHHCPIFSVISDEEILNNIWKRLNSKKILVERGLIGGEVDVDYFLREPLKVINESRAEFSVRICSHENDFEKIIEKAQIDDIYLVSDISFPYLDKLIDTNIEMLETKEFGQLKYLLQLNNTL